VLSVTERCPQVGILRGNFHVAVISNTITREHIMTFAAEELPTFSIKTFNLQNLLKVNNTRAWPTGLETLPYVMIQVQDLGSVEISYLFFIMKSSKFVISFKDHQLILTSIDVLDQRWGTFSLSRAAQMVD